MTLLNQMKFANYYVHNGKNVKFNFCNKEDYWIFHKSSYKKLENYVNFCKKFLKINSNNEGIY